MTVILVADTIHDAGLALLEAIPGAKLRVEPSLDAEALVEAARDVSVLIVRSTRVSGAAIEAARRLSLIVRAGAGVNTIDLEAAGAHGIFVSNCPGMNADAVAELTLGLILSLDRQIPDNVISTRSGRWNKKRFARAAGLKGQTLGVVGTGQIGRCVIERAHGFGLKLVAWSRSLTEEGARALGVTRCESLHELAACSDIMSVHLALCDGTRGLINASLLGALRDGAMVINTSRAGVVEREALEAELRSGRLRAGLDVFHEEPASSEAMWGYELASLPNVVGTHHIGASTDQAQRATATEVARVVGCFFDTGSPPNCVNLRINPESTHGIVVRHADRVGILAGVLNELKQQGHNVQEMNNRIFLGKRAASAKIGLERSPSDEELEQLGGCDGVFHVDRVGGQA